MKTPRTPRFARALAAAAILATAGASHALAVDSKDNAALRYWRVFSWFDRNYDEAVGEIDWSHIGDPGFTAPPEAVKRLLGNGGLVSMTVFAASLPDCDFGVDYDLGPEALLPHLGSMRRLAQVMPLDARLKLDAGETDAAVQSLVAALRMARHVLSDKVAISSLVSISMVAQVEPVIAFTASKGLSKSQRESLFAAIDAFDADDPFAMGAAIRSEGEFMSDWLRRELVKTPPSEELLELLADSPEVLKIAATNDAATIDEQLRSFGRFYDRAAPAVAGQDTAEIARLTAALEQGEYGALATALAPASDKLAEQSLKGAEILEQIRTVVERAPDDAR